MSRSTANGIGDSEKTMKKLILKCGLSPGDIVMLSAAVRDLHQTYPGQYVTDVRTSCPEIWEHNPHITPLSDDDPEAEPIDCSYPLINRCSSTPYHCLHGFIQFLNHRLGIAVEPRAFKGDIHLSPQEKAWYSQVREVTGQDTPFWIVAAGGKHDITIKWWQTQRFQQVVDYFRGKIQFVQVGGQGHHHPGLDGVIDLRGMTTLRELIRLVYHAQGVLCPVTALMHLAAAVEARPGRPAIRPCVVIAGGREPAHWEAYPGHQFIHTNGAIACGSIGGCWKDRTAPLRDGDERDLARNRCVNVVNGTARCMDMISAGEVVRRINMYFNGGALRYLSPGQHAAARRGVGATANNNFDRQTLNLHSAGLACQRFVDSLTTSPNKWQGRGIVVCGGGVRYFTNAWVCINMLRHLGCRLPVQLWHLGAKEMDATMARLMVPLGVECVDASTVRREHPARILSGWELKPYSILHAPYREVLFLDADNVPVVDPTFLFDTPQFRKTGAIFWPDYTRGKDMKSAPIWRSCGLRQPNESEFESGQIVVDKARCWRALRLTMWFNENSDFYYRHLHGDKETFHLAFRMLRKSYSLVPAKMHPLPGTMCQHDFQGNRIFQHRNTDKWDLFPLNRRVPDFWHERECFDYLQQLRERWDGRVASCAPRNVRQAKRRAPPRLEAVMISCVAREHHRERTLKNLSRTDWGDMPLHVESDEGGDADLEERQAHCAFLALRKGLEGGADYLLMFEDELDFNRHIRHNLQRWEPLRNRALTVGSLFNPHLRERAIDLDRNARIGEPGTAFGSRAFVFSRETVARLVRDWQTVAGAPGARIAQLAAHSRSPVLFHAPSLVQHPGTARNGERRVRQAVDFHADWMA